MIEDDLSRELHRIIFNDIEKNIKIVSAKVVDINEDDYTITVEMGQLKRKNIKLRSLAKKDTDLGLIIIPKLQSKVTLFVETYQASDFIEILKYGDIEKIILNINDNNHILINETNIKIETFDNIIELDNENGDINIHNEGDTSISNNNNMLIDVGEDFELLSAGDIDITGDDTFNIDCVNNLNLNSDSNINLNSNGNTFLNTSATTSPIGRGNNIETHLNNLYDYVIDLYGKMGSHFHTGNLGAPTTPTIDSVPPYIIDQSGLATGDKATSSNVNSTKNFTE